MTAAQKRGRTQDMADADIDQSMESRPEDQLLNWTPLTDYSRSELFSRAVAAGPFSTSAYLSLYTLLSRPHPYTASCI